jgi:hypothetical protein
MGNFFFKDQNTTMNEQSNSQINNSQNIVKPDEIDWDEIDRSVDEFLLKIF